MTLRLGALLERSRANGPGERFVVWAQGCSLACPGCFNPELWAARGGWPLATATLAARIHAVAGLRGVTVTGGEPLEQAQAVAELLGLLDARLDSVVYTGYSLSEILSDPSRSAVLSRADLLVAGRFVGELASNASPWAGSSNKAVHALTGRVRPDEFPECRVEVQVRPDGSAAMTGFPPAGLKSSLLGT